MTACERQTGKLFLAGQLDERHESAFSEHLESCPCCRNWLEEDAGDPICWQMARELSHGSQEPTDFIAIDGLNGDTSDTPLSSLHRFVSGYLAPSDDPAMMGRLGTYEIVGVIGRGGMGIVLKAFERSLNRNIAIKVLDPTLASVATARKRFAGEAKAMAAISHEHVVPIYAVDQFQDLPYFVMEYVVGGTLESRIQRDGSLDIISIVRISVQVAEALAAAHEQGLVHRDIKPGNILLDRGTERVRVADFGLARVASDASYTCSGLIAGTPQYMSPEQARGEPCDSRSDLFSLGSLMYAMCTGHAPFRAETVYGVMQRIIHDEPRGLCQQNRRVPVWLERFIQRLLSKRPDERFDSAEQIAAVLRLELAHLQNPSQVKQPPRSWARSRATSKSKKRRSMVLATAALLLAIAVPVSLHLMPNPGTSNATDRAIDTGGHAAAGTATNSFDAVSPDLSADNTIPLWDVDGTQEVQAQVGEVERTFHGLADDDEWFHATEQIRRRLTDLEQEPFARQEQQSFDSLNP